MDAVIEIAYGYYNRALALIDEKDISGAVEELKQGLIYYAQDVDMLNVLGLCYYYLCDFNAAYNYWSHSLALSSDSRAEEYLNKLKTKEFNDLILDYNLALENINEHQVDKAIEVFENIIKREPELIEPHVILGLCYLQKNYLSQALDCWNTARSIDKGNSKVNRYILITQQMMLDSIENQPVARRAFSLRWVIVVCIILLLGYFTGKYNVLENSYLGLNPKQPGQIAETPKNPIKIASPPTTPCIESETDLFNSAFNLYKDAEYAEATEHFLTLITYGTEEYLIAESIYFAASSYEKQKDYDQAVEYYEKYIKTYPDRNYYDDALYYCGFLLYRSGQKAEARELLTSLINEQPNSIYVNQKVAFILNSL